MKKYILSIFTICLSITLVTAQTPLNSIFWEISGNELTKPSYLFGTHHLYDYQFIKKNENILQALDSVDIVIGEMAIDKSESMNIFAKMMTATLLPSGQSLKKLLTAEQYASVDKCLKENMGISAATFNNMKPVFIQQLVMVSKYMKSQEKETAIPPTDLSNPLGNSMDGFFQEQGKALNKQVAGLETVDDQLHALYDGYSLERQVDLLMEMVNDDDSTSTEDVLTMTNMYSEQNLSGLLELMEKTTPKEEIQSLLINRNNNWIPQIDTYFKEGKSIFIAVGAGHLPGSYGLIHLLKEKGYTLKPIKIKVQQ
jgi:hypothetical protein